MDSCCGPKARLTFQIERTSMKLDEMSCQRKPQAGALVFPGQLGIYLRKFLKRFWNFVFRHSNAGVFDHNPYSVINGLRRYEDGPVFWREFYSIRKQVEDDLFDAALVRHNERQRSNLKRQFHTGFNRNWIHDANDVVEQVIEIDVGFAQLGLFLLPVSRCPRHRL